MKKTQKGCCWDCIYKRRKYRGSADNESYNKAAKFGCEQEKKNRIRSRSTCELFLGVPYFTLTRR